MTPSAVAILIVTYNNEHTIGPCLRSIAQTLDDTPHDISIIDNGSTDDTAAQIAAHFPHVELTTNAINVGFGAAVNQMAAQQTATVLLLLNPDTIVQTGCIQALLTAAKQHPDICIFGGTSFQPDGAYHWPCRQRLLSISSTWLRAFGAANVLSGFDNERYAQAVGTRPVATDIVEGSCLLIRAADWQRLGGFDPVFFLYGEDQDLCLRARHCATVPTAHYTHMAGASSTTQARKHIYMLSARAELSRRYHSQWQHKVVLAGLLTGVLLRLLWTTVRPANTQWRDVWSHRSAWTRRPVHPVDIKEE